MRTTRVTFQRNEINTQCRTADGLRLLCRIRINYKKGPLSLVEVQDCKTLRWGSCAFTSEAKEISALDHRICRLAKMREEFQRSAGVFINSEIYSQS